VDRARYPSAHASPAGAWGRHTASAQRLGDRSQALAVRVTPEDFQDHGRLHEIGAVQAVGATQSLVPLWLGGLLTGLIVTIDVGGGAVRGRLTGVLGLSGATIASRIDVFFGP
jgi:hypothetical protein